jgi:hypothetical protein
MPKTCYNEVMKTAKKELLEKIGQAEDLLQDVINCLDQEYGIAVPVSGNDIADLTDTVRELDT